MNTLIANAIIIDGTRAPAFRGAVSIRDDIVTSIIADSTLITPKDYDKIIDAQGAFVAPGFIDVHSHTDLAYFLPNGLKPKITQGITTEIIGQCGFSVAPLPQEKIVAWRNNILINDQRVDWCWGNFQSYVKALQAYGLENNAVPFVGHGALRFAIAGSEARALTAAELCELQQLARIAFQAGAAGLSFGLIYLPAIFANQREIEALIKVAAECNKTVTVHLRSESDDLIAALQEMVAIAKKYGAKLHISHLKAIGRVNWPKLNQALQIIRDNGLTFDHYPYSAGSTTLMTLIPPFAFANMAADETIFTRLTLSDYRTAIKQAYSGEAKISQHEAWDNLPLLVGWENIIITAVATEANKELIGKSIQQIADEQNKDPADAVMDLLIAENGQVMMIDYYAREESVLQKLRDPNGVIGSDTLMVGRVHPRVYGTFPHVISEYVFKSEQFKLEDVIAKMSSQPAKIFDLNDRGVIAPGYKADIVVFSKDFRDNATYAQPEKLATGLEYLFVNGGLKVDNGNYLRNLPGKML